MRRKAGCHGVNEHPDGMNGTSEENGADANAGEERTRMRLMLMLWRVKRTSVSHYKL